MNNFLKNFPLVEPIHEGFTQCRVAQFKPYYLHNLIDVKKITAELKNQIKQKLTTEEKVKVLKNKYEGSRCFILCGNLSHFNKTDLKEILENELVISLKNACLDFEDISDFCIDVFRKDETTDFSNGPIRIILKNKNDSITNGNIELLYEDNGKNIVNSLAVSMLYDDYDLDKNIYRPYGPGLFLEIVFYLCNYIGVKTLNILGWDLSSNNFYYNNEMKTIIDNSEALSLWLKNKIPYVNVFSDNSEMKGFNIVPRKEIYNYLNKDS